MNIKTSLIIFLFFHFIFDIPLTSAQLCPASFCDPTEPLIKFPFRIQNIQQTSCGYPGFNLFCDAFNRTLIDLPNSGRFKVHAIEYEAQNIWLGDPDHCLPRRLLELNLSGSPFNSLFYQDFTLFNCTSEFDYAKYNFDPIGCLSGDNFTVFASSSETEIRLMTTRCRLIKTVSVPVQWQFYAPVMTYDLTDDMQLTWSKPSCGRCEERGGVCGLKNVNDTKTSCRFKHPGLPRTARYAIVIGIGLPAFLFMVAFLYFLCSRVHSYRRHHHPMMEFSMVVGPRTTTVSGLDGPTIESYPKTILGESCRLPMPDNNICSICLSEYMPKETLRTIPECQHCFHVECIDKWLRLNSSCPVCRNSPKSSQS